MLPTKIKQYKKQGCDRKMIYYLDYIFIGDTCQSTLQRHTKICCLKGCKDHHNANTHYIQDMMCNEDNRAQELCNTIQDLEY
jgi:hypothetical protein